MGLRLMVNPLRQTDEPGLTNLLTASSAVMSFPLVDIAGGTSLRVASFSDASVLEEDIFAVSLTVAIALPQEQWFCVPSEPTRSCKA